MHRFYMQGRMAKAPSQHAALVCRSAVVAACMLLAWPAMAADSCCPSGGNGQPASGEPGEGAPQAIVSASGVQDI
ncbi:hypothetical protein M5C97_10400 [Acidovorax sp. NCPPB 3859]|nr:MULTISPECIES: hypothetical protein [unclassified Acidovorax]MDA8451086.1 hypothetical protein [Acidovorax sp. GBBC 3297]MDA8460531.1 hypothetical protein [Acidovorax sp. GBBC 3333]MDA8465567.1 hypothetical protein [Acidovorax sp. GBBC 3332]MDA8470601.1 hypothetical protein [Acidovorax sp. GBBC 3299]WCM80645.1 hypothetical protein M5C94_10355 [Acidovorax sp. GBBC 712]